MAAALRAKADIVGYCRAYSSVLLGLDSNNSEGAPAAGAAAAEKQLNTVETVNGIPRAAAVAAAIDSNRVDAHDFTMDVYPDARDQTRKQLIANYEGEHWIKTALVHLAGQEGGGPLIDYFYQLVPAARMSTD